MTSIIESCWTYLITNFSDFQLACLGSFLLHESVFFLSGLPFIYLERAGWLSKYKIQVLLFYAQHFFDKTYSGTFGYQLDRFLRGIVC
ncbi:putative 4-alpha-methylsterol monooxygenase [Helianthus annuus]|nr:putative 4-alpha-methylsterol monooxygenase [Helianthus annuus]